MKEGYWINYRTDKEFLVREHEEWIRAKGNARRLGVPKRVIDAFGKFKPVRDRGKFLLFVMQHSDAMRVRGHGSHVTFEYSSRNRRAPIDAIWMWGEENAGPFTQLRITNFATGEATVIMWKDFEEAMDIGGPDAIMRAASSDVVRVNRKIAREILDVARDFCLIDS